jgi:DNA-binding NarL/FixJ family response regulator
MRVVVADDHTLFRDGLVSLLETGGFEVVGQADNGQKAVSLTVELKPELVLLDLHMPVMTGLEALKQIKEKLPDVQVVILTVSDDDNDLKNAIQSGADGYILKHVNSTDFFALLENLKQGNAAVSPSITTRLFKQVNQPAKPRKFALSARETEILKLVAVGKSNSDVARELSLSENTVKFHLKNIMQKLSASNRTEAAIYAQREGII